MDWYDPVLWGFALLIVFPDRVLDWIAERIGKELNLLHLLLLEAIAISSLVLFSIYLVNHEPRFQWWHPCFYVGACACFRAVWAFIVSLFD